MFFRLYFLSFISFCQSFFSSPLFFLMLSFRFFLSLYPFFQSFISPHLFVLSTLIFFPSIYSSFPLSLSLQHSFLSIFCFSLLVRSFHSIFFPSCLPFHPFFSFHVSHISSFASSPSILYPSPLVRSSQGHFGKHKIRRARERVTKETRVPKGRPLDPQ